MNTILIILILIIIAPAAYAHQVGISRGTYNAMNGSIKAELAFARSEMIAVVPQLDLNNDGKLTESEIATSNPIINKIIVGGLKITTDSKNCAGNLEETVLTESDGLLIRSNYKCQDMSSTINFNLDFLNSFARGHRHLATATAGDSRIEVIAFEANSEFQLTDTTLRPSTTSVLGSLFHLGIEHILAGYDHLLFLFGLILIGGGIRQLMIVVTSFTLAHSITLGMSAFGLWAPSSTFVEPAIALSIAYVGVENWFIKNASRRWLITFPFGLIHGFGFAGALGEIALPQSQIPLALASFNLGVEAGQLAFLVLVMPVILWLRRQDWFAVRGIRGLSTAIVIAGVWMLIARIT